MARSECGRSSDESSDSDVPDPSRATPKCRRRSNDSNATHADSAFDGTPQKQFDEQDGQSDDSANHTPAQPSKRQRLPTVSPKKKGSEVVVAESDSDSFEPDSLFDSPQTGRKRGFQRPRKPWSLVNEWSLDKYDREVAYEQIVSIMEQSLDDAGSKKMGIKPGANSIAGFRPKQVSTPLSI